MRTRKGAGANGKQQIAAPKRATTAKAAKPRKVAVKAGIRVFVSYSHKDAGAQQLLRTHLVTLERDGVAIWFDGDLDAGDALDPGIGRALREAHVFVALFSPDYLASNYCWNIEYRRAMNRRARGTMRVVAVVVRPCDWRSTRAARFKLLPTDGRPVTRWRSADDAYLDVVEGIRGVVKALRKETAVPTPKPAGKPTVATPRKTKPKAAKTKPLASKAKPGRTSRSPAKRVVGRRGTRSKLPAGRA